MSRKVILAYLNFNKKFIIHTNTSNKQLGVVITKDNYHITFQSKNINKY